ncbi:acyl carrier protein [Sulfitobacter sp. SK012]|uniref:ACP S-malonyltransferase n=1 Tax=Sulfitobacter sp. SK012 TaxID=1389005 RepID=UPI000E0B19B6|nr:ACP S-malonyltransferase [Sulfitobacter sp. SK012]AXI46866.1 acyl carrier protein [Sulfitobacter sp. SK012]
MKKTAVIICPGRGTYNKGELGYLGRHHADQSDLISQFDELRTARNQETIRDLDSAARFSGVKHTRGDNASPLIFASSYFDAQAISNEYDVLAATGNSMGWYIALAVAGALASLAAFEVVNTMGTLMQDSMIGGQTLYPFVDDNWIAEPGKKESLLEMVADIATRQDHDLAVSIHLGGMLVVAGNELGLRAFESAVPPLGGRYPMRLPNHAAFHTALQCPIAKQGQSLLSEVNFSPPDIPLVDGRGAVWHPRSCRASDLWGYTLGHQVVETYDFTTAVQVAAKTFAPDVFITTGPGTTLGGAVAQSLIAMKWDGISSKDDFQKRQEKDPILVSIGRDDQRSLVTRG